VFLIGTELPSDYNGVAWIELDSAGAWKYMLVRRLIGADINVDANRIV
jgi:hypothetical protein